VPFQAEQELRADIKYLLSKFYLYYSILPVREGLRDQLTMRAVLITTGVVGLIGIAIALNVAGSFGKGFLAAMNPYSVVLVTVLTVALAGIIGGCVSMLQRIQSAPGEGDALFNMAALTNGRWGIILSPLYGGIFASLLFVLFAAGVLQGSVFPKINTPIGPSAQASPTPTPNPSATPTPTPTPPTPTRGANRSPAASAPANVPPTQTLSTGAASTTQTQTQTPTPTPTPTPTATPLVPKEIGILQIRDFLRDTGPRDGLSYSLLIIWSFLAGFLERLVPDTLNRLVAKNEAIQGSNS
jgi:nitrate reductase NapE component